MKVYLAGPINACSDDEAVTWRDVIKSAFIGSSLEFLDPIRRDYRGKEAVAWKEIVEGDKQDIDETDIFVAHCWKPSWGTSMEIFYAHQKGIPVVCIVSEKPSPWLIYHSTKLVPDLSEAIRWIRNRAMYGEHVPSEDS